MKDSIIKASIAEVQIGHLVFEGLMSEGGAYGIALPQICSIFQFLNKNASRDVKALLGNGFEFLKWRTTLNPKSVNVVLLNDFERLIRKLDRSGNKIAQDIVDDLIGLSLHQLFSDAFGLKFEKEDRQEFLKTRQEGKQVRLTLTDAIDWYLKEDAKKDEKERRSANYVNFIYSNCSDLVNLGLFGRKSKRLCIDLKISDRSKLRDFLTTDELRWLSEIEDLGARLIVYQGFEPMDAVREAVSRVAIPKVERTA